MNQFVRRHFFLPMGLLPLACGVSLGAPNDDQGDIASRLGDVLIQGMVKRNSDGGEVLPLSQDELKALIERPGFKKNILKWKMVDSISSDTIKELAGTSFMRAFMNNTEWQQAFWGSGPNPYPELAIRNLALLCKGDPQAISHPLYRKLATATALEYARRSNKGKKPGVDEQWGEKKMVQRYGYFRSSHSAGLLNPMFDSLDCWDMRILTGCTREGFGSVESLKWQRDNVRLPAAAYTGACWQAPYRLINEWGESIHVPEYYRIVDGLFPGGTAQMTKEVGAVCGGLSHFGAYAAIANGIPALTMGEPGHCAYTVRVDGKTWTPAYSLSHERGCHWNFYGTRWSDLILTQDMFSRSEHCANAFLSSWAGQLAKKSGDVKMAQLLYETALEYQPVNYPVWMEYLDLVKESGKGNGSKWKEISKKIINSFSRDYPEIAWDILEKKVYPEMLELLKPSDMLKEITAFNKSLDKMRPIRWQFGKCLDKQLEFLSGLSDPADSLIDIIVSSYLTSDDYGAPAMSWCVKRVGDSPELMDKFVSLVMANQGKAKGNSIEMLAGELIRLSGKSADIATFQSAGKLVGRKFNPSLPKYEPFPGELLSSGGLLQLSSFAENYCAAWRAWGVIEPSGGSFHTQKDDPAVATVIMPRIGDISGIVICGAYGQNKVRCNNMLLEASLDGVTWTKVGTIPKMQDVNRIDLTAKPVRAKYLKITRPGSDFFHLNGIHIYGKKAS